MATSAPEAAERGRDAEADLDLARLERPLERRPQVPLLLVQALQPGRLLGPDQLGLGHLREREVALGVGALHRFGLARFGEPTARVLADRLEEDEAGLAVGIVDLAQQALVDERAEEIHHLAEPQPFRGAAHGLGRLERAAAAEDAEPGEQLLLTLVQELVAPVDRAAQVCCRSGRSRAPVVSRSSRFSSRAAIACGLRSLIRAAASSIASGRPSSRCTISATAASFSSLSAKPGLTAWARSTKSATACASSSGSSGYWCSPRRCSGAWLVTSSRTLGIASRMLATNGAASAKLLEVVQDEKQLIVPDPGDDAFQL